MSEQKPLGDQLLSIEPMDEDLRRQLLQESQKMFVKELTLPRKIFLGIVMAFALGSAAVCGSLALTEANLPMAARVGLGTGTLFGLVWFAVLLKILRRGTLNLKSDARRIAQMVWVFTLLMVIFFFFVAMTSMEPIKGLLMIGQALMFLISAAVYWLSYRIEEAELNLKEQMLRIELQLAQSRTEK